MANNIDKKEPVAICDQSKIDVTKCDNHELAGNIEPLIKVILNSANPYCAIIFKKVTT